MILITLSQLFNFKALQPCICVIEDFTRKYIKLCFYPYRVMHFFHFLRFCFMVKKSHWLVFSSLFNLLSLVLAAVSLLHHLFPESQILQYEFLSDCHAPFFHLGLIFLLFLCSLPIYFDFLPLPILFCLFVFCNSNVVPAANKEGEKRKHPGKNENC